MLLTLSIGRLLAISIISLNLLGQAASLADSFDLEATEGRQWYRGNMHTHSLWSDGDDYLDNIALWYRDHDYQFLVFTDHNVLSDTVRWIDIEKNKGGKKAFEKLKARFPDHVEERTRTETKQVVREGKEIEEEQEIHEVRLNTFQEVASRLDVPGKFLLIQGEEISDEFQSAPIHLNASNIQELIPPMKGGSVAETIQNNIRAVLDQREKTGEPMVVHLNHPNFGYAVTAEDMMLVRGERFFEVYNGHPRVNNVGDATHAGTERIWDILLTGRLGEYDLPVLYGLATDDSHYHHETSPEESNPGRGWVMVLANELTVAALLDALEAGHFYASSGVALKRIAVSPEEYRVEIDPVEGEEYVTEFFGTRSGYDWSSKPVLDEEGQPIRATHRYSEDVGEILATVSGTTASFKFQGDELYVRARVTSSAKANNPSMQDGPKQAWCQPVMVGEQ